MATIIILLGSILGFVSGLTAYFGFDASLWTALSVWVLAGPVSALMAIIGSVIAPQHYDFGPILAKVA